MILGQTPGGFPVKLNENSNDDESPRFSIDELPALVQYYENNGYAVIRDFIDPTLADDIRSSFASSVKSYSGKLYRQATAKLEKNEFNEHGFLMNPILNIQSLSKKRFSVFVDLVCRKVLGGKNLQMLANQIYGEPGKIVQTMYFEGNSATWEHQDTYYLDSSPAGQMMGCWIAIEKIECDAGRFFIVPGSHKLELENHNIENNIVSKHDVYIEKVRDYFRENNLHVVAPALNKGDCIIWNSRTIHGALDDQKASNSRSSITCHVIPKSKKFLQFQAIEKQLSYDELDGIAIHRPKDQNKMVARLVKFVEAHAAPFFYFVKGLAIKAILTVKS